MATCATCIHTETPTDQNPCSECKGFSKYKYKPQQTNGDRIRSLSDETLAEKLYDIWRVEVEQGVDLATNWCNEDRCDSEDCNPEKHKACILRWLQQPAEKEKP